MKMQIGKLLTSSPISAQDTAAYIVDKVSKGSFMIFPHEQDRVAWALKQKAAQLVYEEMAGIATKMLAKG